MGNEFRENLQEPPSTNNGAELAAIINSVSSLISQIATTYIFNLLLWDYFPQIEENLGWLGALILAILLAGIAVFFLEQFISFVWRALTAKPIPTDNILDAPNDL